MHFHLLFLTSLLTFSAFKSYAQNLDSVAVVLTNNSELIIRGSSNLTHFKCQIDQEFEKDTIILSTQLKNKKVLLNNAMIAFNIDKFHCGQPGINRDFKETLKYKEYPNIYLRIQKVGVKSLSTDSIIPTQVTVSAELELAGKKQDYEITFEEISFKDGIVSFKGSKTVHMTDFDITPPRVLLGLIQVNDQLNISFEFSLLIIKK
jgi:hypothetical protein